MLNLAYAHSLYKRDLHVSIFGHYSHPRMFRCRVMRRALEMLHRAAEPISACNKVAVLPSNVGLGLGLGPCLGNRNEGKLVNAASHLNVASELCFDYM